MQKGTLYIVSTPIGNLEDITLRAIRILREVGLIAAEDTRRTRILLNAYQIDTPLTSLHDRNELKKGVHLIARLNEGIDMAYVSDAGTPGISDPGYIFVKQAIAQSIKVVPVPGPVAAVAALNVSGIPMDSFVFFAFLPSRRGKRRQLLESIKEETKTMVFYESPNRLVAALKDIGEILGDRQIAVSRELTKIYEETLRGTVSEVSESLRRRKIKGEITLVISGAAMDRTGLSAEEIRAKFQEARKDPESSTRDIVDALSEKMDMPKKEIYRQVLDFINEDSGE
ncbi:MAG: 16S rRNA (cytidine(1402)-2'-O)-methyltransferase [Deltaproteobacteria bacterium]|nr:16S rRNA (cytidine(1402)-2'-O)-methyltransferase [Deltaproteobacteria bacterium]MBW2595948.1 16S rRNA (cytidine(1402)-2'-O)-methyltransferase [Deltaproteobacteria bacterium]MBW2650380.1 16S rRNA (cytidine(1402)-2'-O)-methyltransferase [Deltaproteobacteria bacterium]